jgi:hypothetical protein
MKAGILLCLIFQHFFCSGQSSKQDSVKISQRLQERFSEHVIKNKDTASQIKKIYFRFAAEYIKVLKSKIKESALRDTARIIMNSFYKEVESKFGKTITDKLRKIFNPPITFPKHLPVRVNKKTRLVYRIRT